MKTTLSMGKGLELVVGRWVKNPRFEYSPMGFLTKMFQFRRWGMSRKRGTFSFHSEFEVPVEINRENFQIIVRSSNYLVDERLCSFIFTLFFVFLLLFIRIN